MAKFREFYVPSGAGSNFLAKQCVWLGNPHEYAPHDINQNEFFINRVKCDSKVMAHDIRNSDPTTEPAKYYDCPDKSILSESKRIKPILIELDRFIGGDSNWHSGEEDRKKIIDHCDHIWREDYSVWSKAFFNILESGYFYENDISEPVVEQIREVEDYFEKCRRYYYDECERNNWDMFQICHMHPYLTTSPRLKLPKNMLTMAMEVDNEMNMYNNALIDIKMREYTEDNYFILIDENDAPMKSENLYVNRSVKLSDSRVSFRRIYFENDENEIRRMYDFFDNEDYFDKNRVQIMSEFRQYHDDNMKLVQKLAPNLYEQINGKI
jgi:hypothetical protein